METKCLLLPGLQKLYSALLHFERFSVESDFFENISNLDAFFSEFRSITFVLKKSLRHTQYYCNYEQQVEKYLNNDSCRWLKDTRNKTQKVKPFELVKKININAYLPDHAINLYEKLFTANDDIDLSTLLFNIKSYLAKIDNSEVFFSAEISFFEAGSEFNIHNEINSGITRMNMFVLEIENIIDCECNKCTKLRGRIDGLLSNIDFYDLFLAYDFVYYPSVGKFERSGNIVTKFNHNGLVKGGNLGEILPHKPSITMGLSLFERFVAFNVLSGQQDFMPTTIVIYDDDTFELDMFHSTIKTTMYRKINNIAKKIRTLNVKEVYLMMQYLVIPSTSDLNNMSSRERATLSSSEILVFTKMNKDLDVLEYSFETHCMSSRQYLLNKFQEGGAKSLQSGIRNTKPIIEEFSIKNN